MAGRGSAVGEHGSTAKLAHNGVAAFLGARLDQGLAIRTLAGVGRLPLLWSALRQPAGRRAAAGAISLASSASRVVTPHRGSPSSAAMREIGRRLTDGDPLGRGLSHEHLQTAVNDAWRAAMHEIIAGMKAESLQALVRDKRRLRDLGRAQSLLGPYLLAAGFYARQQRNASAVRERLAARGLLQPRPASSMPRVAMFTDTFDEINGVATVLREVQRHGLELGWPMTIVSAGTERSSEPGREVFQAVDTAAVDLYPSFPLALLPLLEVLRWCQDQEVEVVRSHAGPRRHGRAARGRLPGRASGRHLSHRPAQPGLPPHPGPPGQRGPVGLCARVLQPVRSGVLSLPTSRLELTEHRLKAPLADLPHGIDSTGFDPALRDEALHDNLGGGKKVLLWVGRLSPEKGLDALAPIVEALRLRGDAQVVLVGDGPHRSRLTELLPEATFLGVRSGRELARIYASADVFLFPGSSETFGLTMLEAAASGLPAVVTAGSGTESAMVRDVTALSVAPGDVRGFVAAIERLLDDEDLRAGMARAARAFALEHGWQEVLEELAGAYRRVARWPRRRACDGRVALARRDSAAACTPRR